MALEYARAAIEDVDVQIAFLPPEGLMTDKNDGRLDPRQPNKFEPEHHEPFPGQPKHDGHGSPGEKTDQQKKNR